MKPYIREGLRMKSLYMVREQDSLNTDGKVKSDAKESLAAVMYADGVFSWQFPFDFHDTGRAYLKSEGDSGPWTHYEKSGRENQTLSDRSVFPMRSLIPVKMNGLIGAQGNVGFSSIVSSAIRLHDHRVHIGQAAAAIAVVCLHHQTQPRDLAWSRAGLEEVQAALCGGTEGVPMLLWPYRDLPADHPAFVAINRLAARGLLPQSRRDVDFRPESPATDEWRKSVLALCKGYDAHIAVKDLLNRGQFAQLVWNAIRVQSPPEWTRKAATDADADGVSDLDDPTPYSEN